MIYWDEQAFILSPLSKSLVPDLVITASGDFSDNISGLFKVELFSYSRFITV